MSTRVVVTGGAGFIGRHLVRSLVQSGKSVLVIDDGRCGRLDLLPGDVEVQRFDIADLKTDDWTRLLRGASTVFHLAAAKLHSPSSDASTLIATNVVATQKLAEAASGLDGVRVVFASSLYAHGGLGPRAIGDDTVPQPSTIYGATKLMGEGIFRSYERSHDLSWVGARLFFTYGSGQFAEGGYPSVIIKNFGRLKAMKAPVIFGSGKQALDYVHVSDVVRALNVLATKCSTGRVVNVCSGSPTPVENLVSMMAAVAEVKIPPEYREADWTEGTIRVGVPSAALTDLGWAPNVPLEEGLRECWSTDFA